MTRESTRRLSMSKLPRMLRMLRTSGRRSWSSSRKHRTSAVVAGSALEGLLQPTDEQSGRSRRADDARDGGA